MSKSINCKAIAQEILDEVKAVPNKKKLMVVSLGNARDAKSYLKGLRKDCDYCGIELMVATTMDEMYKYTQHYYNKEVGGFMALEPIPEGVKAMVMTELFGEKDIDGLTGRVSPCIAEAVLEILNHEYDNLTNKNVLIIGRGKVGKAVAKLLLEKDCNITVCHSKTSNQNIRWNMAQNQIIVSAVGKPHIYDNSWISDGSTVIDCGTSFKGFKLCGDIDILDADMVTGCKNIKYTPVPNGVGLVTRAVLLRRLSKM